MRYFLCKRSQISLNGLVGKALCIKFIIKSSVSHKDTFCFLCICNPERIFMFDITMDRKYKSSKNVCDEIFFQDFVFNYYTFNGLHLENYNKC